MMNLFNLVWHFLLILIHIIILPIPVLLILILPIPVLPILIPFILIILICSLYMKKLSLALCYMEYRQKNNSSQGSSNLTWSTISTLTSLEKIKPFLLGLVLIVSFILWHCSYILLIDKLIQLICELISKVHNCLLNSNLNHLKTLWKFLKSFWTLINAPFSLLLSASVLLYFQSKRNRIKKIILEDNEKHLKDVVILNKDLLYWLNDNLFEISETIDQMITFKGEIDSLKAKAVGKDKEIEVNKLNTILTELFTDPNLTVTDSYFASNKNIFNMYNTLKQLKKSKTLQDYFTEEGIKALKDNTILSRDTILDLIESYYYLFLGWKTLPKVLYTPQKMESVNAFLDVFIKKIDKFL